MPVQASSSARPGTSSSTAGRPTTAGAFVPYDPTFDEEYDDDEDSDDEDVFAFLPPTTAEQQEQQAMQAQMEATSAARSGGGPAYQEMGGYGIQYGQESSPYATNGAGTAAATATTLQAQYYGQQQQHPHAASSPFSHSPFAHGAPENPSSSTLDITPSTSDGFAPSTSDGFDPWARPSTAHLVPNVPGPSTNNHPYGSGAADREADNQFASQNSYPSVSTRAPIATSINTSTDPYAAYNRPSTSHLPPRSPPSPSTDSHPSTGTGMPSNGGDVYKLRRLTSMTSVPGAGPAVTVEGGRRIVQSEDDDDDDEYEAVGAKEVVVNLPGAAQRRSSNQSRQETLAEQVPDSPHAKLSDDDGASETAGSEKDHAFAAVVSGNTQDGRSKSRRKRAGKHRSRSSATPRAYAGDVASAEAGAVTINALDYVGAVASGVQVRSGGNEQGQRRMKNLNAQPYYGYAALANAHGYDYGSKGASRPNTRGTIQTQRRTGTSYSTNPQTPGLSRQNSTSGSFVAAGKRKGKEFEDGDGIDYDEDADSMSMSGISASVRDDESREGSIKYVFLSFFSFLPFFSLSFDLLFNFLLRFFSVLSFPVLWISTQSGFGFGLAALPAPALNRLPLSVIA